VHVCKTSSEYKKGRLKTSGIYICVDGGAEHRRLPGTWTHVIIQLCEHLLRKIDDKRRGMRAAIRPESWLHVLQDDPG